VGYDRMKTAVKRCSDLGIKVVTIFAFSTDNWDRPKEEIDEIFRVIRDNMHDDTPLFMEWNVRVTAMGDITRFPKDMHDQLVRVMNETKNNTGTIMNLCINYGGRDDIVRAVNAILCERKTTPPPAEAPLHTGGEQVSSVDGFARKNNKSGKVNGSTPYGGVDTRSVDGVVTEEIFSRYLYGAELPPPDFIVRTSGEQRISNFMLWQMAYSEFLFIKPLWPDVTPRLIDKCVIAYSKRKRRFGRIEQKGS